MTLDLDLTDAAELGMLPDRLRFADELMQRQFDEGCSPMLAAVVARHGRVVFEKTLGDQRPGGPPLTLQSVFPLASNGKPMTATTLLALVERGMVALTDPVTAYLPELSTERNGAVLVHHLLTHTSGWDDEALTDSLGAMVASGDIDPTPGRDVLEHLFLHSGWEVPRSRNPGDVMQYTNFNYTLIGEIIRRVTGGTFDATIRRFVFDPVGMSSTAVIVREPLLSRVVERPPGIPHAPGHPETVLAMYDPLWLECDDGGAGVHATPLDNLRFLEMIRNGGVVGSERVLSPASIRMMTHNQIPGVRAISGPVQLVEASWSYGFSVGGADPFIRYRGGTPSRGTLRHGGSGGIMSWVDLALGITGVYYELLTEEDANGGAVSWAHHRFEDVITSSVIG